MDALIKKLTETLGISEDQARKAAIITADYLEEKLPKPIFSEIEMVLDMPEATSEEIRELGLFKIP